MDCKSIVIFYLNGQSALQSASHSSTDWDTPKVTELLYKVLAWKSKQGSVSCPRALCWEKQMEIELLSLWLVDSLSVKAIICPILTIVQQNGHGFTFHSGISVSQYFKLRCQRSFLVVWPNCQLFSGETSLLLSYSCLVFVYNIWWRRALGGHYYCHDYIQTLYQEFSHNHLYSLRLMILLTWF